MIVDSMTHEEVYQELERDRENISRWWAHQQEGRRRALLKCKTFPVHVWQEYTSPRKNKYLFYTRILDKRMKRILTCICAVRRTSEGMTLYTTWLGHQKMISPMVLLPHVWKRYRERMGLDLSGIDLFKHYFQRNTFGRNSYNQKAVGRSVRYAGMTHLSYCVNEGVLLGQVVGDLFVAHTFITYEMTSGLQQQEFTERRSEVKTDKDFFVELKSLYH